jgi:hypothetical protein
MRLASHKLPMKTKLLQEEILNKWGWSKWRLMNYKN